MNHDEKTTEIEIPTATTPKNNIVRVDFGSRGGNANPAPRATTNEAAPVVPMPPPQPPAPATAAGQAWAVDLDLRSPWVLRLIAVMFVLLLSMLVL